MRISSINVTKSAVSCGSGHSRNSQWKTSFFVHWKISNTCARQMLCLEYRNLQERRNISKLYMIARGHWVPLYGLKNECANGIFYKRKIFWPKYHWLEVKYLGAMQNRRGQPFCLRENAFSQYTPAFAQAIVAFRRELERLYIYSIYIQTSLQIFEIFRS